MSKAQDQFKITLTPYLKNSVHDIAEKLGVTKAAYIRMCIKKDVDDRGYKKSDKWLQILLTNL